MCEFVCVFGSDIGKVLNAYGGLCGRWVNERAPGPLRSAHQRFFKSVLAMPLCAAVAMPAALAAGMNVQTAFAALAGLTGVALALAAFVSLTGRLVPGLLFASVAAGGLFSLIAPLAGPLAVPPLALMSGAETLFITRKPALAIAAAACAALTCAALGGFQTAAASMPASLALVSVSLAYLVAMPFRARSKDAGGAETEAPNLAAAVMDAAGIVRAKMRLTGEIYGVEGNCGDGFNVYTHAGRITPGR